MGTLDGRIAVVTGASAGIGEAVARDLVAQGASVVLNARRKERLEALAAELGDRTAVVAGDASEQSTIDACLTACEEAFGGPADLVVVNAGRGLRGGVLDSDEGDWEEVVRTNLLGAARLLRAAANAMAERQSNGDWQKRAHDIVVLGSTVGRHISPFSSMYGSTKFAVHSIAEAVRREVGPKGVRVSIIEPGVVASEFQQVAGYDKDAFGQFMEKIGPVLMPEDIARLITFVCSQPPHVHLCDGVIRATRQDYP
ncbi:MAG: SDR family oxidoreductase [Planctomycetota bacterium]